MRGRREERREERQEDRREFGRGGTATKYKMREKLVSFGDDFWIENDNGQRAFKVNGKMLRIRDTLIFETPQGQELVKIQTKMLSIRGQMRLERSGGPSAVVKKDLINIVRDHLVMEVEGGEKYEITGNLLDHEYTFSRGRDKVAEVSKKWFRLADTYGVEIEPGADDVLILAATVAVDQLCHDVG